MIFIIFLIIVKEYLHDNSSILINYKINNEIDSNDKYSINNYYYKNKNIIYDYIKINNISYREMVIAFELKSGYYNF
jgi:hypothetical protein